MKGNAEHWDEEYSLGSKHFHALASSDPSISTLKFVEYLEGKQVPFVGNLLEVGCGMGRNTNWLAKKGFNASGMDISKVATEEAIKRAKKLGLKVKYISGDMALPWPLPDNSLDFVLDFVTSHLLDLKQLSFYLSEVQRVLRGDGKLALYTLDRTKDQQAQRLLSENPGPGPHTYVIPEMNHIERALTLEEIAEAYSPFVVEHSELVYRPTRFGDQTYEKYYWFAIFKKLKLPIKQRLGS